MSKRIPFNKLSDAKKRVRIAKDVIAQIHASRLKPKQSTYLKVRVLPKDDDEQMDSLLKRARRQNKACTVCALGGIFACTAIARDKVTASEAGDVDPVGFDASGDSIRNYLSDLFNRDQLALVECAFECTEGFARYENGREVMDGVRGAVAFGRHYRSARGRMLAIMQNIVDNGGEFVPGAKP